jgi:hypothetical protein
MDQVSATIVIAQSRFHPPLFLDLTIDSLAEGLRTVNAAQKIAMLV